MSNYQIKKLSPISIFLFISLLILSLQECPRDKPILKNNSCTSDYCSIEEFQSQICVISNYIIQTQWLNAIHITDIDYTTQITSTMSENGLIFITSQEQKGVNNKYFFGINQKGLGIFYNKTTNHYYSFQKMELPENIISTNEKYIEINNKGYLISAPKDDHIFLYDYTDNSYSEFLLKTPALYSDSVSKFTDYEDTYVTNYIHCNDTDHKICHTKLLVFTLNEFDYDVSELLSIDIPTKYGTHLRCLVNEENYIQCMQQEKSNKNENQTQRVINFYYPMDLSIEFTFVLEDNDYTGKNFIESMIKLKRNVYIMVYCNGKNQFKVLVKNVVYYENLDENGNYLGSYYQFDNYVSPVKEIILNSDSLYSFENSNIDQNSIAKIANDKFAIFLIDNSKTAISKLVIYILNIYNSYNNINVRHYTINFGLYGHKITDNVKGFYLNDFLGISIGLSETKTPDNIKSGFIVFGYINSTDQNYIDTNFIRNDSNSIIKLKNYIKTIENNLFGYEYLGIRITYLPDEEKSGSFYNKEQKIKFNDTLDLETTLKFSLSKNHEKGTYSIKFAGIIKEPDFSRMNSIAEKIEYFPNEDTNSTEEKYYKPKILIGREVDYKFKLGDCFDNCESCITLSGDENYQQCRKCKQGYYFVENTRNCFQKLENYYLDNNTQILKPCHENCETCNGAPLNMFQMNCKSCDIEKKYFLYDSTNCLKCPKYVNYLQTECIDEIPKGYYLNNAIKRTLGKCHPLCESCDNGPFYDNEDFFMNCNSCIYKIENWKINAFGICPEADGEYIENEEEEEEEKIVFECPVEKPIYKNKQCILDYCDQYDYSNHICVISNRYIKTQWINNFHTFDDDYTSHLSVDINEKGDVVISAQEDYNPNHKYFFGFDKNGTGIFYNVSSDSYSSFKKYEMKSGEFAENMIFVTTGDKGEYFMSGPSGNNMYIFDYKNNKYKSVSVSPYSQKADKLFKLNGYPSMYFTDYTYCRNATFLDDCYIEMKIYELNSYNKITYLDDLYLEQPIPIEYDTKVTCLPNDQNLIQCMYRTLDEYTNTYSRSLYFYYPESLELVTSLFLEIDDYSGKIFIDDMIRLKKDVYIFAYNSGEEIIQVVMQTLNYNSNADQKYSLSNYISDFKSIFINEDLKYSFVGGSCERNHLLKINENKFAMFLKENTGKPNSNLLILIFDIYNNVYTNSKTLIVKHYMINFNLYNMFISGTIRGFYLNDFLGVAIGLTLNTENYLNIESGFMIFGYVNGTDIDTIDTKLNFNNTNSIIKIKDYIGKIENNLFGYNFTGVKIISLPNKTISGYFINNKSNETIKENDIIKINTTLRFILSDNFEDGIFSIQFAPVIQEPEYEEMVKYTRKIEIFPKTSDKLTEKKYYSPKTLLGKLVNYRFKTNHCYPSCFKCLQNSNNETEQLCLECNIGYYFLENTSNCYSEKDYYYLNKKTNLLEECNENCLKCNGLPLNDFQNNCKACPENYKLYDSTNCLNCPLYVNYLQTECISQIPNGYYLQNKDYGTLGKCHPLCRKCSQGPIFDFGSDLMYMNCDKCLYKVKDWEPQIAGNCPDENEGEYEEEEDDETYSNKCPRNTPILMDGICKFVFCNESQFEEKKCIIANKYAKIQWINNFYNFGNDAISYVSVDITEDGEVFIVAQKEDYFSPITKYIVGIKKNGQGHFYDDDYDTFYYQIEFDFYNGDYLDNIKYLKKYERDFIIATPKNNIFYFMDLDRKISSKHYLNISSYKSDKLFKLNGEENIYFSDVIVCEDDKPENECKLNLRNYDLSTLSFEVFSEIQEEIIINGKNQITCIQNNLNYIQCVYTEKDTSNNKNKHILAVFEPKTLKLLEKYTLEESFYNLAFFDSMINFKDNVSVIAYSSNPTEIKVLLKELSIENNKLLFEDYITEIPYMLVGDSSKYDFDDLQPEQNCLFKISENKFAIFVKDYFEKYEYSNYASNLVIYIFSLFDMDTKVNIRSYEINFPLYDVYISGKIRAYNLNNFLGIAIELTKPSSPYSNNAKYLTFGYVNTIYDLNYEEGTIDLIIDESPIVLKDYIGEVENNLFGYEFKGVKVLSLPPENVGFFVNRMKDDEKVLLNQILDIDAELDFGKMDNCPKGNYSITFVSVLEEPSYEKMNNLSLSLQNYPKIEDEDTYIGEDFYYSPETLYGKIFNYSFEIKSKDDKKEDEEEEFEPWEEEEEEESKDLCPRNKPILIDDDCFNIYCKKEDFENEKCVIANKFIEKQWLNNFHLFDESQASYVACDVNEKGEVFLFAQREVEKSVNKYLVAFDINGTGLFYDNVKERNLCYKSFNFPSPGFADKINYVEVSGEGNLMTSFAGNVNYLIDYYKQDILNKKSNVTSTNCDNTYKLKNEKNMFFTDFIYCDNEYLVDNCSVYFRKYNITKKNIIIYLDNYKIINVHSKMKLKCLQNEENYIRCLYTIYTDDTYTKLLSIIDTTNFNLVKSFTLLKSTERNLPFDDMIILHEDLTILAHSIDQNIIQVLFKKITISNENGSPEFYYEDYINDIPYINLNEDNLYKFEGGDPLKNSMTKISDTKFAIAVNDYKNSGSYKNLNSDLVLFIFSIYNKNKYINVRHYPINFKLYNIFIEGDIKAYNLGGYFGLLLEATSPDSSYIGRATFITFGFCNTTDETTSYENTINLIDNKNTIKLSDYIKNIENNLFGYEFLGVKILEVPPEENGYFVNTQNGNAKVEKDQIISKDSELKFIENKNIIKGTYSIIFAAAVEEPDYNKMNSFSTKVETYPKNKKVISEGHFYKRKILLGKQYKYSFNLGQTKKECYKNCETCSESSTNYNDQKCIKCKTGFYFKYNTKNCFDEITSNYYLDTRSQMFMPCYKNCYKCITKEINETKMNCVSCNYGFKYYEHSLNCLNCPKYVNHLQTECIDKIPTGYFLKDKYLGTIEKCYSLCKTCEGVEYLDSKGLHMNCLTCLYNNPNFKSNIEGNCPDNGEENTEDEKDEDKIKRNNFAMIFGISIGAIVVILLVIVIVLSVKCGSNKKEDLEPLTSNYKKIHGNVPMEDDQSLGI